MANHSLNLAQQQRMQLALAPQMRQSLELLQAPLLELRTLVRQEVEQNPTLEEQPQEMEQIEIEPSADASDAADAEFESEFERLAQLDDEWRDYFNQNRSAPRMSAEEAARRQHFFDSLSQPESLQQHLMNQLMLAGLNKTDRQIGELLIGSINDEGYLTTPIEELAEATGFTPDELKHVLSIVQEFDPVGVGSRDLRECLMLQLHRLDKAESTAAAIVQSHLDDLGAKRFADIARALTLPIEEIHDAARVIATLEPKPGRIFSVDAPDYVTPEVAVQKIGGKYTVIMNNDQVPHLHISNHYRDLMSNSQTSAEVKAYIREKVRAGLFLIKSIGQRQQTIFNIAQEIVEVQREFLEHGVTHLRPLTMAQVAAIIGVHETTVSRAVANKFMQTPRGTFEMKYFFTPGYRTADGQEVSNKAIKDAIAKLVADEDTARPLSDQDMVKRLSEQGFTVARRTIAKYRDALKILPSHLRKGFSQTPPAAP